jgi:SOS-response transcriptional repressor LexA
MRCKKDKEFPKLTTKQADFFRLWEKKKGENGGVNPTFAEMQVNGYSKAMCAVYLKILRSRDFLPKTVRCYPPQKDTEFPDIGKRTADTLRAIRQLTAEHGIPPSLREIAKTTKTTHNAVNANVNRLIQSGYLKKAAGLNRSLRLTEKAFTPSRKTMEALRAPYDGPLPDAIAVFAEEIMGVSLPSTETVPSTKLRAKVGDVEMSVNTGTGVTVFRHKDGTRVSLELPPGDPIHRKAAFADLLWILQGATVK